MTECPACGADVPADGRYCPSCGREISVEREHEGSPTGHHEPSDGTGRRPPADSADTPRDSSQRTPDGQRRPSQRQSTQNRQQSTRRGERPPDNRRGHPQTRQQPRQPGGVRASPQEPNPANHKLLVGSVSGLSVIGALDGLGRVAAPSGFTEQLMEASRETGMELDPGFAEQVIFGTGVIAILLSLLVIGLTVRNYRNQQLPKRYFWVMIGAGVVGLILASNLFLALLIGFGIYGLVSVTN